MALKANCPEVLNLLRTLCRNFPSLTQVFYSLYHVNKSEDPDFDAIAATDGISIFYGKEFFTLSKKEQLFVIMHEVLHVLLGHPRLTKIDEKPANKNLLNIIEDAVINTALYPIMDVRESEGFGTNFEDISNMLMNLDLDKKEMSKIAAELKFNYTDKRGFVCIFMDQMRKSANVVDIYKFLTRLVNELEMPKLLVLSIPNDGSSDSGDSNDNKNNKDNSKLANDILKELSEESKEYMEERRKNGENFSEEVQDQKLNKAIENTLKDVGNSPSGNYLRDILLKKLHKKFPWRRYVKQVISKNMKVALEKDKINPDKNFILGISQKRDSIIAYPRKLKFVEEFNIMVFVDVSGSISDKELWLFLEYIASLQKDIKFSITLAGISNTVHIPREISRKDNLVDIAKEILNYSGGTDFQPAVDFCKMQEKKGIKYAAVFYFTDLESDNIITKPYNFIWLVKRENYREIPKDMGKVVVIEE